MLLYHTTMRYNRHAIEQCGICTRYSQGKMPAVWLHSEDKTSWAYLHCVRRHGGLVQDVITFAVEVDEDLVKRSSAEGLFYTLQDVEPQYIRGVFGFRVVSESPIKEAKRGG